MEQTKYYYAYYYTYLYLVRSVQIPTFAFLDIRFPKLYAKKKREVRMERTKYLFFPSLAVVSTACDVGVASPLLWLPVTPHRCVM